MQLYRGKGMFAHVPNLFEAVAICLCIAAMLFALGACSPGGTVMPLASLAQSGSISDEDIKNIAALRNGCLQIVTGYDEDGKPTLETVMEYAARPSDQVFSEEQQAELLRDFVRFIEERYQAARVDCEVTESRVVAYYGTYSGYAVAEVEFAVTGLSLSEEKTDLVISDYYFGEIAGDCLLIAWAAA